MPAGEAALAYRRRLLGFRSDLGERVLSFAQSISVI